MHKLTGLFAVGISVVLANWSAAQEIFTQSTGKMCGMSGTAKSVSGKDLDRHKNRFIAPDPDQIDDAVTLAALLAPGDDQDRFDQEKGAAIIGYVIDVKVGGKETCNCEATDPIDRDTHIELGLSPDAKESQLVIVEVTPRLRAKMKAQNVDCSTDALKRDIKGKWVEITGWLLFDTAHTDAAENTHPGGQHNWRGTCWEIHPITAITVLEGPPEGAQASSTSLAELHRVHRAHATRTASRRDAIAKRNQDRLSVFHPDERELEGEIDSAEAGRR
jgi:hypothetical protein